ncbi:MlaD family protein [Nocardia nova]|uniref:MlaD family protein n=1 Tax=Nocardia nova TaxID=37330 RepID=UPI00340FE9A7
MSIRTLLSSRGFVTAVAVAVVAVLMAALYFTVVHPPRKMLSYCAIMPDSVGLYAGNHVTTLGLPVGTVAGITPDPGGVRVEFTVDARYPLRGEATATTISNTIVADRDLAVLGEVNSKTLWDRSKCITTTFTPKSITDSLHAFSVLSTQLNGPDSDTIRTAVTQLDGSISGTGPRLNDLINNLAKALRSPDAAIGHIGQLLDAMGSLTGSISVHWDELKDMLVKLGPGLTVVNSIWDSMVRLMDSLLVILTWGNQITHDYGQPILGGLDASVPYMRMLRANVDTLEQLVNMIPAMATAFQQSTDPQTGKIRLTYATPQVTLPDDAAKALCSMSGQALGSACYGDKPTASLATLIFATAGAR